MNKVAAACAPLHGSTDMHDQDQALSNGDMESPDAVKTSMNLGGNELSKFSDTPRDASLDDLFHPLDKNPEDRAAEASTSASTSHMNQGNAVVVDAGKNDLATRLRATIAQKQMENEMGQTNGGGDLFSLMMGVLKDGVIDIDGLVFDEKLPPENLFPLQAVEFSRLVGLLRPEESEEKLISIFHQRPEQKIVFITQHGLLPLMELLEVPKTRVIFSVLQLINQIVKDNTDFQENACLVGLVSDCTSKIPVVMSFAGPDRPREVRMEAAYFLQQLCQSRWRLVDIANVHCLPWNTYPGGFSRVGKKVGAIAPNEGAASTSGIVSQTASVLSGSMVSAEVAREYLEKVADLLLEFSQADTSMFNRIELPILLKILKCIDNLSTDPNCLENLQRADAIKYLIPNLELKMDLLRQEQAAENGIIPHLMNFIMSDSPLKPHALPLLCDMAHASRNSREQLRAHCGLDVYLSLLDDMVWSVTALDSIAVCLAHDNDNHKVEQALLKKDAVQRLVKFFQCCPEQQFVHILEPFLKIITKSSRINTTLAVNGLTPLLIARLDHQDAIARLNLLKLIKVKFATPYSPPHKVPFTYTSVDLRITGSSKPIMEHVVQVLKSQEAPRLAATFNDSIDKVY
uniref:Uncharacterized protein n=1 Tax=Salix viminalis TaxID=40686 RepID=A0A6N2MVS0_SALVM